MRKLIAGLAAVGASALVACGGGSDETRSPSAAAEAPSKAEYIAWRDRRCAESERELAPLERDYERAAELVEFDRAADAIRKLADAAEERLSETRERPTPSEDAALLRRVEDAGDRGLALARRLADVLEDVDPTGDDLAGLAAQGSLVDELTESIEKLDREGKRLAKRYGFEDCGR